MLTRRHIRRWLVWAGIGLGVIGLAGYVLSFVAPISHTWSGDRRVQLGRGGFAATWTETETWATGWVLMEDLGTHWRWLPRWSVRPNPFNPQQQIGQIVVPYWVLLLIGGVAGYALLPPGYPRGRCVKCGYDLDGVPAEGGRVKCPECGEQTAC